jgi:hypothetical protein
MQGWGFGGSAGWVHCCAAVSDVDRLQRLGASAGSGMPALHFTTLMLEHEALVQCLAASGGSMLAVSVGAYTQRHLPQLLELLYTIRIS